MSSSDVGREAAVDQRRIAALLGEVLNVAPPAADVDLFATGVLDSLGLVELLVQLEQRLSVHVEMEELDVDAFRTIASIAAFVARKQDGG